MFQNVSNTGIIQLSLLDRGRLRQLLMDLEVLHRFLTGSLKEEYNQLSMLLKIEVKTRTLKKDSLREL
jgi:hypothetical protein